MCAAGLSVLPASGSRFTPRAVALHCAARGAVASLLLPVLAVVRELRPHRWRIVTVCYFVRRFSGWRLLATHTTGIRRCAARAARGPPTATRLARGRAAPEGAGSEVGLVVFGVRNWRVFRDVRRARKSNYTCNSNNRRTSLEIMRRFASPRVAGTRVASTVQSHGVIKPKFVKSVSRWKWPFCRAVHRAGPRPLVVARNWQAAGAVGGGFRGARHRRQAPAEPANGQVFLCALQNRVSDEAHGLRGD